jgi:hypothetical protein
MPWRRSTSFRAGKLAIQEKASIDPVERHIAAAPCLTLFDQGATFCRAPHDRTIPIK